MTYLKGGSQEVGRSISIAQIIFHNFYVASTKVYSAIEGNFSGILGRKKYFHISSYGRKIITLYISICT